MVLGVKGVVGAECVIKAVRADVTIRESVSRPSTKPLRNLGRNLGEQCSDSGKVERSALGRMRSTSSNFSRETEDLRPVRGPERAQDPQLLPRQAYNL